MRDARTIATTGILLCSTALPAVPECAFDTPDDAPALEQLAECARGGDTRAQLTLGHHFLAIGDAGSEFLAATWFLAAARNGDPDAQYQIGMMFLDGRGVTDDAIEGFEWIAEAARQGHRGAEQIYRYLLENPEPMEC